MKKIVSIILLISLMLTSSSCFSSDYKKVKEIASAKKQIENKSDATADKVVPEIDFKLKKLSGKEVKLSSLRGQNVVINFFTSTCEYCKKEMPYFIETAEEYKNQNVIFLFVDVGENAEIMKAFLKSNSFDIDPLLDADAKVYSAYGTRGVPTTVLIGRNGNIYGGYTGLIEEVDLKNAINKMVK